MQHLTAAHEASKTRSPGGRSEVYAFTSGEKISGANNLVWVR